MALSAESSDVRQLEIDRDEALDEPPPPAPPDSEDPFAEFEDELEGENTRIEEGTLLAEASTAIIEEAPAQPFLFVERGKDQGREFVLQEGENAVGRGIDNDVILADVAVSRRHLIVIRDGDLLRLRDLGSGNGTIVNGKKLSSGALMEGDRLEVGETTLVVRQPGASLGAVDPYGDGQAIGSEATVAEPAPLMDGEPPTLASGPPGVSYPTAVSPRPFTAGTVVIPRPVFVGILAGGALLLTMFGAAVAVLALRDSGAETGAPVAVEASSSYARGIEAYNGGDYAEARVQFQAAVEEGDSPADAADRAASATQASVDQQRLAAAREQLQEDPVDAINVAQEVLRRRRSPLRSTAQTLLADAQARRLEQLFDAFQAAERAYDLPRMREVLEYARATSEEAHQTEVMRRRLAAVDPEEGADGSAEPLPADGPDPGTIVADAAEPESQEPDVQEPVAAEAPVADERPSEPGPEVAQASRGSHRSGRLSPESARRQALAHYRSRRFSRAAAIAREGARSASGNDRTRLNQLSGQIDNFDRRWSRIQSARYSVRVANDMRAAIALDRQIAGDSGHAAMLRQHLVQAYLQGIDGTSDPVLKCRHARALLAVEPNHRRGRGVNTACELQARQLLTQAEHQSGVVAERTYRRVLGLSAPGSAAATQATSRLQRLRSVHRDEDE